MQQDLKLNFDATPGLGDGNGQNPVLIQVSGMVPADHAGSCNPKSLRNL